MSKREPAKIRVKLNPEMEKGGQGLCDTDPLNPTAITEHRYDNDGSQEVYATEFVLKQIEAGALIKVDGEKQLEDYTRKELEAMAADQNIDLEGCKTKGDVLERFARHDPAANGATE